MSWRWLWPWPCSALSYCQIPPGSLSLSHNLCWNPWMGSTCISRSSTNSGRSKDTVYKHTAWHAVFLSSVPFTILLSMCSSFFPHVCSMASQPPICLPISHSPSSRVPIQLSVSYSHLTVHLISNLFHPPLLASFLCHLTFPTWFLHDTNNQLSQLWWSEITKKLLSYSSGAQKSEMGIIGKKPSYWCDQPSFWRVLQRVLGIHHGSLTLEHAL